METIQTWPRATEAAAFFEGQFQDFAAKNPPVGEMATRFAEKAGVNILALVDHWVLPDSAEIARRLDSCGLVQTAVDGDLAWEHPKARLPRVRLRRGLAAPALALIVEEPALFARQNALDGTLEGEPDSAYQAMRFSLPSGELLAVARRGYRGFRPGALTNAERDAIARVRQEFAARERAGDEARLILETREVAERAVGEVGQGRAVDEFFAAEREFYMARNDAARWQYEQQQALGLGWANHDHHTYRSSRESFGALLGLWKALGFTFRERYYAGADAGWGAQIVEHPVSRVVIFSDVDMAPEELDIDFLTTPLAPRTEVGTIGLWCALHGSSVAAAGMHHLECEFDFARAQAGLEAAGFGVMAPFTDLPILRQAFTQAQVWPVERPSVERLLSRGSITGEQAERFVSAGAAGSHLEILQRWDGFKGFNKTGVSAIIRDTDARRAALGATTA